MYGVAAGSGLIAASSLPAPVRADPLATPFASYWSTAVFLGIYLVMAAVFGLMPNMTRTPEVEVVFPTPLRRSSLKQVRMQRALLGIVVGGAGLAALMAAALSAGYTLSFERELLAVLAAVLPPAGIAVLGIALLVHAWHTWSERRQTVVASVVILGFLLWFLALLFVEPWYDDPLIALYLALLVAPTKLVMGFPLDAIDLVELGVGWVLFLAVAIVASTFPYRLYEDYGTVHPRTRGALSRERGGASPSLTRMRLRLRTRYRDLGVGVRALIGRNLTLGLRGTPLMFNLILVGLWALFTVGAWTRGARGTEGAGFVVIIPVVLLAGLPISAPNPANEGPGFDAIRILPLTPAQIFLGYALPVLGAMAGWAVVITLVAWIFEMPLDMAVVLGGFTLALAWFVITTNILVGVRTKRRQAPLAEPVRGSVAYSPWTMVVVYAAMFQAAGVLFVQAGFMAWSAVATLAVVDIVLGCASAAGSLRALSQAPRV